MKFRSVKTVVVVFLGVWLVSGCGDSLNKKPRVISQPHPASNTYVSQVSTFSIISYRTLRFPYKLEFEPQITIVPKQDFFLTGLGIILVSADGINVPFKMRLYGREIQESGELGPEYVFQKEAFKPQFKYHLKENNTAVMGLKVEMVNAAVAFVIFQRVGFGDQGLSYDHAKGFGQIDDVGSPYDNYVGLPEGYLVTGIGFLSADPDVRFTGVEFVTATFEKR